MGAYVRRPTGAEQQCLSPGGRNLLITALLLLVLMYCQPGVRSVLRVFPDAKGTPSQSAQPLRLQIERHRGQHANASAANASGADKPQPEGATPQQQQQRTVAPQKVDLPAKLVALAANTSRLGSSHILDAAVGVLDLQKVQQLIQEQQAAFCKDIAANSDKQLPKGAHRIQAKGVHFYTYAQGDIVSSALAQAQSWEEGEMVQMRWALQQYKPVASGQGEGPVVLDVGANIGTFTLALAAAGARVLAFEAMEDNLALLRRSLCANPTLQQRVVLFGVGLGSKSQECVIASHDINLGDGHTLCGKDEQTAVAELNSNNQFAGKYRVRGRMSVRRLDTLLDQDIHYIKMDVEGFEQEVMEGAKKLLERRRVNYIMAEANPGIIGVPRQREFVRYMVRAGYRVSFTGFAGPFLEEKQVAENPNFAMGTGMNLFCTKKDLAP